MADESEVEALRKRLADVMGEGGSYRNLQVALDAALQKHKDDAVAHETDKQAALKQQAEALTKQHAAAVQVLKEKYLFPALRDLHQKQQADLAAKQAAELQGLTES